MIQIILLDQSHLNNTLLLSENRLLLFYIFVNYFILVSLCRCKKRFFTVLEVRNDAADNTILFNIHKNLFLQIVLNIVKNQVFVNQQCI